MSAVPTPYTFSSTIWHIGVVSVVYWRVLFLPITIYTGRDTNRKASPHPRAGVHAVRKFQLDVPMPRRRTSSHESSLVTYMYEYANYLPAPANGTSIFPGSSATHQYTTTLPLYSRFYDTSIYRLRYSSQLIPCIHQRIPPTHHSMTSHKPIITMAIADRTFSMHPL